MNISIRNATDPNTWDAFLASQPYAPFLQSWTMGEVYRDIGQEPIRLEMYSSDVLIGVCFGHIVAARRGKHLSIPYGPVFAHEYLHSADRETRAESPLACEKIVESLIAELKDRGRQHDCAFVRLSPFWPIPSRAAAFLSSQTTIKQSPLHLLAEHLWVLPLTHRSQEQILMDMRKTTRNLIRRAERDGVTIERSAHPNTDIEHFLQLHDETSRRHGFTAYTHRFFRAQVKHFSAKNQCTLYLARYQHQIIASAIHMHFGGETSYHHGASTHTFAKIPASYLLQWTAIVDALQRGDRLYNFWGIAPPLETMQDPRKTLQAPTPTPSHPFSGVTTFKTGFGGQLLELMHCIDIPLSPWYTVTRTIELLRKWRRGF